MTKTPQTAGPSVRIHPSGATVPQTVCLVTPYPLSRISGISQFVRELGRALNEAGVRVVGWCPAPSGSSPDEAILGLPIKSQVFRNPELAARTALQILRSRGRISLVHAHQFHLQSAASLLTARFLGRATVLTIHLRVETAGRLRRTLQRIIEGMCLRFADAVVAVSSSIAATLPSRGVHVIANGVDVNVFRPSREERTRTRTSLRLGSDRIAVFAGRWARKKGLDLLYEAFGHVASRQAGIRLVVIGEPAPDEPSIEPEQFMDRSTSQRVHVLGRLKDSAEVAAYLNAADVFVLPSLSEGMPLALMEALATGLPVIASDIPVHRTLIHEDTCGWLVTPGNVSELGRVLELFAVQGAPAEWGSRARNTVVRHYSIQAMAESYLGIYSQILARRPVNVAPGGPTHARESDPY